MAVANLLSLGRQSSLLILLLAMGCGGSNQPAPTTTSSASSAPVTVTIGDAPIPGLLAFEVTINNITLTGPAGTVTVLSTPAKLEVSHLAGTFIPLTLVKVPTGTYTQMSVTLGASEVLFLPPGTTVPLHKDIPAPAAPINIALSPAVTVSAGASSLNLDLNVLKSLDVDSANNVTFTPAFLVTMNPIGAAGQQDQENGEADDIKGTFVSFSGTQFTIKVGGSAQPLTFNTDSSTIFDPSTLSLSTIKVGTVLEVDASTQADGLLLAKKIEVESENQLGLEIEGLVTATTGTPVTSFQLIAQEVSAPSTVSPNLGSAVTVNLDANTSFRVNPSGNLTIPSGLAFNASTLAPGQSVEADADIGGVSSFTARRIQLKEEAVDGTISALNGTAFLLTLDPNSTLAKLSGKTSINVSAPNPSNKTGVALANGQIIRARGLLFFTPAAGTSSSSYTLVARQIRKP